MIERLSPPGVPAPRGPYSPVVRAGDFLFVSGQVPVDPATQQMSLGDIAHETRRVLLNIQQVLEGRAFSGMMDCSNYLLLAIGQVKAPQTDGESGCPTETI